MSRIDVYTAGCPLCEDAVGIARTTAGDTHEVVVHDLRTDESALSRAREAGVASVPAVSVDGQVLACCRSGGVSRQEIEAALA